MIEGQSGVMVRQYKKLVCLRHPPNPIEYINFAIEEEAKLGYDSEYKLRKPSMLCSSCPPFVTKEDQTTLKYSKVYEFLEREHNKQQLIGDQLWNLKANLENLRKAILTQLNYLDQQVDKMIEKKRKQSITEYLLTDFLKESRISYNLTNQLIQDMIQKTRIDKNFTIKLKSEYYQKREEKLFEQIAACVDQYEQLIEKIQELTKLKMPITNLNPMKILTVEEILSLQENQKLQEQVKYLTKLENQNRQIHCVAFNKAKSFIAIGSSTIEQDVISQHCYLSIYHIFEQEPIQQQFSGRQRDIEIQFGNESSIDNPHFEWKLQHLTEQTSKVMQVEFRQNDSIVSRSINEIIYWEKQSDERWRAIQTIEEKDQTIEETVCCFTLNNNGNYLGTGSLSLKIWEYENHIKWQEFACFNNHEDQISCLTFNSENNLLISGDVKGSIMVYEKTNNMWQFKQRILKHCQPIQFLQFTCRYGFISASQSKILFFPNSNQVNFYQISYDMEVKDNQFINFIQQQQQQQLFVAQQDQSVLYVMNTKKNLTIKHIWQIRMVSGMVWREDLFAIWRQGYLELWNCS